MNSVSATFVLTNFKFKMTPEQWWSQIIERSVKPLLRMAGPQAADSAPSISRALIQHFASSAAYELHEDARELIWALKKQKQTTDADFKPIIGILSNFDPRVRNILKSFGFAIGDVRPAEVALPRPSADDDIDFVLISYDLGIHKPDAAIFEAAANLATQLLPRESRTEPLLKIHVGDSLENDAKAALQAGWHAVLIDRDGKKDQESPKRGLEYARDLPPPAIHTLSSLKPWNPCILRNLAAATRDDG